MLKTKLFIGKTMAKKFYGDAMKSMKELSGKKIAKFSKAKVKAFGKTPFANLLLKLVKKLIKKLQQVYQKLAKVMLN